MTRRKQVFYDEAITTFADGEVVIWDAGTLTFTNASINAFIDLNTASLDDIGDVNTPTATGQVLRWDGTNWTPYADSNYLGATQNAVSASKWLTARTITLTGDVSGSAQFDGSGNFSVSTTVSALSHDHDSSYYTEAESDSRFFNVASSETLTGTSITHTMSLDANRQMRFYSGNTGAGRWIMVPVLSGVEQWNREFYYDFDNARWGFDVAPYVGSDVMWHAGNDGSGSGLDADLLDGLDSTAFSLDGHSHVHTHPWADITKDYGEVVDISTIEPDDAAAAGVLDEVARADHVHAIAAAAPSTTLTPATTNAEGTGTSFARAAHTHAITGFLPTAGGTMTGFINLHADPGSALQAATKQYVDNEVTAAIPHEKVVTIEYNAAPDWEIRSDGAGNLDFNFLG